MTPKRVKTRRLRTADLQLKSFGKKEPQLRKCSTELACGHFFKLMINVGRPSSLWMVPPLGGGPEWYKKVV